MISCQNADGLQGLAKAHVVTQDPVQLVFVQEGQPVHSILQGDTQTHTETLSFGAGGFTVIFSPESVVVEVTAAVC